MTIKSVDRTDYKIVRVVCGTTIVESTRPDAKPIAPLKDTP